MNEPRLQVLICTFGERIANIDFDALPRVAGVGYLISWQNPDGLEAPPVPRRPDIEVHAYADRGLSVNRNHSLNDATAPYVLISDDDLEYSPEGLMAVIGRFDADPDLALATFRSATQAERVFPPDGHDLAVPFRNYYAISVEIALRRDAVERFGLRFSPLAGIGAPELIAGEEDLFVHHAIISGCRARYFDIMIARHAGSTTAERQSGRPELVRTKGAVLTVVRGVPESLMRFPLEAARCGGPWLRNCGLLLGGMFYALKHRQEL